jgi:hypothetical protein
MQSSRERGWVVGILQRIFERHRHRVGDDDGQHDVVEGLVQHDVDRGLAHRHVHSETPQRRRWRLPILLLLIAGLLVAVAAQEEGALRHIPQSPCPVPPDTGLDQGSSSLGLLLLILPAGLHRQRFPTGDIWHRCRHIAPRRPAAAGWVSGATRTPCWPVYTAAACHGGAGPPRCQLIWPKMDFGASRLPSRATAAAGPAYVSRCPAAAAAAALLLSQAKSVEHSWPGPPLPLLLPCCCCCPRSAAAGC